MTPTSRWKAVELWYCAKLGGRRRGADYGDFSGGKSDCADELSYSVEIRHRKTISYADIISQVAKAEARAHGDQIPIAISHTPGTPLRRGLVSMSFETFLANFVGGLDDGNSSV